MSFSASALSFMLEGFKKTGYFYRFPAAGEHPANRCRENLIAAIEIAAAEKDGAP